MDLTTGDTLIITRTIQNNESFTLEGLYFSDNIPSEFTLSDHSINLNDNDITILFNDNIAPSIIDGYNTCDWVVDDPDGNPQNRVNPGDILVFELKLTCGIVGDYQLPFHATAFTGGNSGFFSTDNAINVTFSSAEDTTPPAAIIDLEAVSGE
jgi:hypothetical protein